MAGPGGLERAGGGFLGGGGPDMMRLMLSLLEIRENRRYRRPDSS